MIVKGLISAIDAEAKTIDVILPEYGNIVTPPLKAYGEVDMESLKVNDFVLVIIFNNNFNDGLVLIPPTNQSA